eukprot:scaffold297751_cov27-Prasinocladus_malaysianus.AAC.1
MRRDSTNAVYDWMDKNECLQLDQGIRGICALQAARFFELGRWFGGYFQADKPARSKLSRGFSRLLLFLYFWGDRMLNGAVSASICVAWMTASSPRRASLLAHETVLIESVLLRHPTKFEKYTGHKYEC